MNLARGSNVVLFGKYLDQPEPTILKGSYKIYIEFHIRNLHKGGFWLVKVCYKF